MAEIYWDKKDCESDIPKLTPTIICPQIIVRVNYSIEDKYIWALNDLDLNEPFKLEMYVGDKWNVVSGVTME